MEAVTLLEIQQHIQQTLEQMLPESCWVTAEINDIKTNSAGHCYLELVERDAKREVLLAKASATIWAHAFRLLKPYFETAAGRPLSAGIRVLVRATVQYHAIYGLSLSVTDINPAYTVGEMEMQRRETILHLQQDGVFDLNREILFPQLPQRIAILSSEQAAGYRDFIKHLNNNEHRYAFRIQLFPSQVQGNGAVQSIIHNLALIGKQKDAFDVVVIIRGGGAVVDLACFDEYDLASHVAQFPLPVLTGIGHEKDQSIVDLVAHKALKTPTAAADFLISCLVTKENQLHQWETTLNNRVRSLLQSAKNNLQTLANRRTMAVKLLFQNAGFHLQMLEKEIHHKNPQTILQRGYAIVLHKGVALRDAEPLRIGDELQITLYKGTVKAVVTDKHIKNNEDN